MPDALQRRTLARGAARLNAASAHAGLLPPLILMTDDERLDDPFAAARALPRGCAVIVRSRDRKRRAALAAALVEIGRRRDLVIMIADDPALAGRCRADGLHLPERRAHEAAHWRASHPDWLITASAHSFSALARAAAADAVLLSPVFRTASHEGRRALSPIRANALARASRIPVYALGGINSRNVALLRGFVGVAAIGALKPAQT